MKKQVKDRFKFLVEYGIRSDNQLLMESFIDESAQRRYNQRLYEMELLKNDDIVTEDESASSDIIQNIKNNNFEVDNRKDFIKSMNSGQRVEFLTPYTEDELNKMKTYKVNGYNAGFAIKNDGDIVSVHNNTGIGGIGKLLIQAAKSKGGTKLDHFDGFLTGFYQSLGFKVVGHDEWNDDYAPANWKYTPVDPYNPQTSIYANELGKYSSYEDLPEDLKNVVTRYKEGKPDIIYRSL